MQPSPKFSCLEGDIWDALPFPPSGKERVSPPSSFQPGPLPLNNTQGTSQSGSGNGALPDMAICQWCVSPLGLVQDSRIPQPLSQALLSTAGSSMRCNHIQRRGGQVHTGPAFMITSSPSGFNPVQALSQISMGSPSTGHSPLLRQTASPLTSTQAPALPLPWAPSTKCPTKCLLKVILPEQFLFQTASTGCSL